VLLACALLAASPAGALPVLFLVAEPAGAVFHGDSYVLPLEEPADIAHARDLIVLGPAAAGAPIAVARIAAGADGVNRDLLDAGEPPWSWHVTGFLGFADFAIEVLDGWPGYVEQDVDGWFANTNGQIGFWSYTVVAEIGPVPEPASGLLLGVGLAALGLRGRRWRRS
jgi:hypothetical protein